jgi:hypothetical protein
MPGFTFIAGTLDDPRWLLLALPATANAQSDWFSSTYRGRLTVVAMPRTQSLGMHPWRRTLGPSLAPAPDGLLFGPDDVQVPRTAQRGAWDR